MLAPSTTSKRSVDQKALVRKYIYTSLKPADREMEDPPRFPTLPKL